MNETVSGPTLGGTVLHLRHDVEEMFRFGSQKRNWDERLRVVFLLFVCLILIFYFREKGREKERKRNIGVREKHLSGCLLPVP